MSSSPLSCLMKPKLSFRLGDNDNNNNKKKKKNSNKSKNNNSNNDNKNNTQSLRYQVADGLPADRRLSFGLPWVLPEMPQIARAIGDVR